MKFLIAYDIWDFILFIHAMRGLKKNGIYTYMDKLPEGL